MSLANRWSTEERVLFCDCYSARCITAAASSADAAAAAECHKYLVSEAFASTHPPTSPYVQLPSGRAVESAGVLGAVSTTCSTSPGHSNG